MYLSTMYLSHHSKTVISADEKVAELLQQRDKLDAQLAAECAKVRVLRNACKLTQFGLRSGNIKAKAFMDTSDQEATEWPVVTVGEVMEAALTATEETK